MRNPTPAEFIELCELIGQALESGQDMENIRTQCQECWPKLIVDYAVNVVNTYF